MAEVPETKYVEEERERERESAGRRDPSGSSAHDGSRRASVESVRESGERTLLLTRVLYTQRA